MATRTLKELVEAGSYSTRDVQGLVNGLLGFDDGGAHEVVNSIFDSGHPGAIQLPSEIPDMLFAQLVDWMLTAQVHQSDDD
jgi:hypothetical protein